MIQGLDFHRLHPSAGDKFSPNLYEWIEVKRKRFVGLIVATRDGELFIGEHDDEFFIGQRLISVLVSGRKAEVVAMGGGASFVEVADFWERYARVGRCAIDVRHDMSFLGDGDRWLQDGWIRTCRWCGTRQRLQKTTSTVIVESWITQGNPT